MRQLARNDRLRSSRGRVARLEDALALGITTAFVGLGAIGGLVVLYWIKSAKRPQTRADRIAKIVAAAADGRSVF